MSASASGRCAPLPKRENLSDSLPENTEPSRASHRILVIDDVRLLPFEGAVHARTPDEGIEKLGEGQWDEVWFDHDMGAALVDGEVKALDIWPVIDYIKVERPEIGKVYVHTWNMGGGMALMNDLSDLGYDCTRVHNLPLGTTSISRW